MSVLERDFSEGEFDAVYSLNCLLHVPNENIRDALSGTLLLSAYG